VLLRVAEAGDGAGDAAGFIAVDGEVGDDSAGGIEIHVARGGGGGLLAIVEEMGGAVFFADEHEAAATDVASGGVDDGKRKAGSDGCIDGVAALFEDCEAGVGCVVLYGDDHGVFGTDGFFGGGLSEEGAGGSEEQGGDGAARLSKIQGAFPPAGRERQDIVEWVFES
jgi:hypothetical protein